MKKTTLIIGLIFTMMIVTGNTSQGEEDVIHACYKKNNGQLRVVDDPSECRPSEIPMSWNEEGPEGQEGPQGEQGEPGQQGDKGDTGATGPQGPQGPEGPMGPQGPQGDKGDTGEQGSAGADGQAGADGLNCWDLDADGVCDTNEDINADNICDALDCQGNADLTDLLDRLDILEGRLFDYDFDEDGFSPATGDCDDADPNINSNAPEIGGDGVDNNCDGAIDNVPPENDIDGDGLTDWDEVQIYGTDPLIKDTDGDSLPTAYSYVTTCYEECKGGTCWFDCCSTKCYTTQVIDYNSLNLSDYNEVITYGTDPLNKDTDGDGIQDGWEIRYGTDPLN